MPNEVGTILISYCISYEKGHNPKEPPQSSQHPNMLGKQHLLCIMYFESLAQAPSMTRTQILICIGIIVVVFMLLIFVYNPNLVVIGIFLLISWHKSLFFLSGQ